MLVPVAGDEPGISPVLGNTLKLALEKPSAITVKLPLYSAGVAPLTVTISSIFNP